MLNKKGENYLRNLLIINQKVKLEIKKQYIEKNKIYEASGNFMLLSQLELQLNGYK